MRRARTRRPARRRQRPPPTVDIVVESPLWRTRRNAKAVLRRAIAEAAAAASTIEGEVAIVLTDDSAIRALNRDWRCRDAATNVLSFPARTPAAPTPVRGGGRRQPDLRRGPCLLGDIVIAYETTEREAHAERKPFAHHLAHLAVHGFLHLVGYDHQGHDEADAMEGLETAILARLDVPNPYVAHARVDV